MYRRSSGKNGKGLLFVVIFIIAILVIFRHNPVFASFGVGVFIDKALAVAAKYFVIIGAVAAIILIILGLLMIQELDKNKAEAKAGESWADKKRHFGQPLSFTRYALKDEKLIIDSGIITKKTDQIMLYRVLDYQCTRGIIERLFGVGTVKIISADQSTPNMYLSHIKYPEDVKDLLSDTTERARAERGIAPMEIVR